MTQASHLPDPLVPAEVDLQDFPFMPLQVARLRDSDLAAEEEPEACWYAVLLWAASWHQIPAGSLPDNDTVLMRIVGLGRDHKTWKKHKVGALRGWILCKDGRLYHKTCAEHAIEAWDGKLRQRHRTLCAAVRKHNERNADKKLESPTFEEWIEFNRPSSVTELVTAMSRVTGENVTRETPSKRKGQGQGQGQGQGDSIDKEPDGSLANSPLAADAAVNLFGEPEAPPKPPPPALKPEDVVEEWNNTARLIAKPTVRDLTAERRQQVKARIAQYPLDDFVTVFGKIRSSEFLRNWRGCGFDWVMKKGNFQKILEGNYDG